jgi:hypothetical protein
MAYEFDSQRLRSTSLHRSEQNGREAPVAGLPQIGQGFSDPFEEPGPGPAFLGGSDGIQPTEANRKTFAAQQCNGFIQRQPDDIGIRADHLDDE